MLKLYAELLEHKFFVNFIINYIGSSELIELSFIFKEQFKKFYFNNLTINNYVKNLNLDNMMINNLYINNFIAKTNIQCVAKNITIINLIESSIKLSCKTSKLKISGHRSTINFNSLIETLIINNCILKNFPENLDTLKFIKSECYEAQFKSLKIKSLYIDHTNYIHDTLIFLSCKKLDGITNFKNIKTLKLKNCEFIRFKLDIKKIIAINSAIIIGESDDIFLRNSKVVFIKDNYNIIDTDDLPKNIKNIKVLRMKKIENANFTANMIYTDFINFKNSKISVENLFAKTIIGKIPQSLKNIRSSGAEIIDFSNVKVLNICMVPHPKNLPKKINVLSIDLKMDLYNFKISKFGFNSKNVFSIVRGISKERYIDILKNYTDPEIVKLYKALRNGTNYDGLHKDTYYYYNSV